MKFLSSPWHSRVGRPLGPGVSALCILFAIGCANSGPPRPPSLRLPKVVDDLTAQRIGDDVELHWTTPSKTTDDLGITRAITAEICRETLISSAPSPHRPAGSPPGCVSVKRLSVNPGPSQATDPLAPALTHDPATLLSYRIQIFNSNGHSAGRSAEAFAPSGAAPPPVEHLRATLIRSGIQLEWQPQATTAPVQLDRLLVAAQPSKPQPTPTAKTKRQPDLTPPSPAQVRFEAPSQPSDPGGVIDRTAQRDQTYRYTAQRVRKLTLAGHALERHSLPSPAITVVMHDIFPPASPSGLAAIPGGVSPLHHSIDLSWEPVPDLDVAGYIVYRQQVDATGTLTGPSTRLTPAPIVSPSFSDSTAVPGHTYAYRVTAIDTAGNESAPSADVRETLREP